MDSTYWHKQTADAPLFPDLLWSRPEHRRQAGKLLIIGGTQWGFNAPAQAYNEAVKAGIGSARVLLPEAVHKAIGHVMEHAESAASTPSGSFSQKALPEFLEQAAWADGVLLAGDLGRNSETAIAIEQFLSKYHGLVTITKDAVDYAINLAGLVTKRENTVLVLSIGQLQKLAAATHLGQPITSNMGLINLVDALHSFTTIHKLMLVTKHYQNIVIAAGGQVSATKLEADLPIWRLPAATYAAVWWLQNPAKPFEALSMSVVASA